MRLGIRNTILLLITPLVAMAAYVGSYCIAWANRHPAANMAYFIYSSNDAVDTACYRVYFPIYWVHTRLLHAGKHNHDREPFTPSGT